MQCETKKFEWNIAKEEASTDQMVLSWYISKTEKEKRRIIPWEKKRPTCGVAVEVDVWRLAANVDWIRLEYVRGSDGGMWVWEGLNAG